jgi:bile acid:Na+ symporter, BASS family
MFLNKTTDMVTFLWLLCLMFHMGSSVTMSQLAASLKKGAIVWKGLATNLLLVPVVAFGLLLLFKPNPLVAAGFLAGVVFSGAPMGPPFTALAKGDVPLSIGLMILLAALSTLISPMVLKLLLAGFAEKTPLEVSYLKIMKVVVLGQLLPLSAGLALNHWHPAVVHKITRFFRILNNLLLLGACSLIVVNNYQSLGLFGWRAAVGSMVLFTVCLIIGWVMGGHHKGEKKALALNTTVRNAPAALVVASTNFPGTVVPAAVFAYSLVTVLGTLVVAYFMGRLSTNASPR